MAGKEKTKRILKRWKLSNNRKASSLEKINGNILDANTKPKMSKKKNNSQFSVTEVIVIVIITAFISLLMGLLISNSTFSNSNSYEALSDEMQEFLKSYNNVISDYYGEVDEEALLNEALESVINSLGDPYSGVVDSSLSNDLATRLQGTYDGFGIRIANDSNNAIYILDVIEDTPALKAGLKVLDKIIAANGKDTTNMSTTDFVELIKQMDEKTVTLTVIRNNEEINIDVTREKIVLKSVSSTTYEVNNKKIGYVYISVFAANTDTQFKTALKELEDSKIDSLIIDLRDNTGGHLTTVENMISEFLDKTHVIYQIQGKNDTTKYYSKGNTTKTYPIAILVNGTSASASELLASTLREELSAIVIGETTYGKGTVQEVQDSTTGVQYKITTQKWLTPKGDYVDGVGVKPDIEVELSDSYYSDPTEANDNQLQTAITELSK